MAHAHSSGDNLVHSHVADDGEAAAEAEEDLWLMPCLCIWHRKLPEFCKGVQGVLHHFKGTEGTCAPQGNCRVN